MSNGSSLGRTPLSVRLLFSYALTFIVLIAIMGWFIDRSTRSALIEDLTANLERAAQVAAVNLPEDEASLQAWADAMFEAGEFRTTVITIDGVVVADSHSDPSAMDNHSDRPEVDSAINGSVGTDTRLSVSTGSEQVYVAAPPQGPYVVRLSVPTRVIDEELGSFRSSVVLVSLVAGFVGVVVVAFVGRRMAKPITELTAQSMKVADGDLDVSPRRSVVREYDSLGLAISAVASKLGQRLTEAEMANEYLATVLEALEQGTILFDSDSRVVYANPSAHRLLGPIPDTLGELSPFQCQAIVRESQESRSEVAREIEHGKPVRRFSLVASPFTDDGRVLLVVDDISSQERAAAVRRDFVANASHELKTPVTTIMASSDALKIAVDRGDPNALAFAAQISASAKQLDELVMDLLDLSRLEREAPDLAPVRLDLLVADEVSRVHSRAEDSKVALTADFVPTTVMASHRDLSIAVRNLLDNAVRYTGEGGLVAVRVLEEPGAAVVEVADSGEGIPTRDHERIFERFYRVDSGRARATGGTGLGLAIARHVVDSHGGSIEVDSELGVGSTFTIRLPEAV